MYVLKRTDQGGGYVAKPGGKHSYTNKLERAQKFSTREAAERAACPENERAVLVED